MHYLLKLQAKLLNAIIYSPKIANEVLEHVDNLANQRWSNYPFGTMPKANKKDYENIWIEAKQKQHPKIDEYEQDKGFAVELEWLHKLALHTQVVVKKNEICYQHGRLLYTTIRHYI